MNICDFNLFLTILGFYGLDELWEFCGTKLVSKLKTSKDTLLCDAASSIPTMPHFLVKMGDLNRKRKNYNYLVMLMEENLNIDPQMHATLRFQKCNLLVEMKVQMGFLMIINWKAH
jgi:hypothetical protein